MPAGAGDKGEGKAAKGLRMHSLEIRLGKGCFGGEQHPTAPCSTLWGSGLPANAGSRVSSSSALLRAILQILRQKKVPESPSGTQGLDLLWPLMCCVILGNIPSLGLDFLIQP